MNKQDEFGKTLYVASDEELDLLAEATEELRRHPEWVRDWADARKEL